MQRSYAAFGMVARLSAPQSIGMEIKRSITVKAPVGRAWSILADDFHNVGAWACGIATSKRLKETGPAGVADRQCTVEGMGTITERVTKFDPKTRSFAYTVVEGAPSMMTHLENSWTLYPKGPHESEIHFCINAELKPIPAFMMGWLMKRQMNKMCDQICIDLKTFIETGVASDQKLNQFARAA